LRNRIAYFWNKKDMTDYERIEAVIKYLSENYRTQPDLGELSGIAGLSPSHFQKMFTEWAGVSPKKFLQYISLEHARKLLAQNKTVFDASYETGLSGTSRLHDLFITIEGMTPGDFRNGGKSLQINWQNYESPYGKIIIAATTKGVCHLAFIDQWDSGFGVLRKKFPEAVFTMEKHPFHLSAISVFQDIPGDLAKLKLHLKGTEFQLKVWEALLKIPSGNLTTYSDLARAVSSPLAARAVGSAVGDNPVAYLIPCHRVIRATGIIGEYHWGSVRKTGMIGRESSKVFGEN
jgi:AraC family transcriptional regulator, regulatory protein of adaptative response / methylated-DNA-[protein]-cysteine methyltransferase